MFDIINVNGSFSYPLNNMHCMQIGLVDVLRAVGIEPDGIVGHSVGEWGCAYVDGCFTAEQMVLAAYYHGLASLETELINGLMAAVGKFPDVINCNFMVQELP
jgi:malonyl CoA-acyl carrier protein transacylase